MAPVLSKAKLSYKCSLPTCNYYAPNQARCQRVFVNIEALKLKIAIPNGWDAKQFEYNYKEIVPQRLQKLSSNNEWLISANLIQKSEMYSLPQTALNWRSSILFALLSTLLGATILITIGRKNNV